MQINAYLVNECKPRRASCSMLKAVSSKLQCSRRRHCRVAHKVCTHDDVYAGTSHKRFALASIRPFLTEDVHRQKEQQQCHDKATVCTCSRNEIRNEILRDVMNDRIISAERVTCLKIECLCSDYQIKTFWATIQLSCVVLSLIDAQFNHQVELSRVELHDDMQYLIGYTDIRLDTMQRHVLPCQGAVLCAWRALYFNITSLLRLLLPSFLIRTRRSLITTLFTRLHHVINFDSIHHPELSTTHRGVASYSPVTPSPLTTPR